MKFLFISNVILTIIFTAYSILSISKGRTEISGYVRAVGVSMLAEGIADISGIIDTAEYHGTFFLCAVTVVSELLLAWLYKFIPKDSTAKGFIRFASKVVAIASLLELTLFNMNSYHLWFGEYFERRLFLNDAQISGGNSYFDSQNETLEIFGKDEVLITYENLGQQVGTLKADIEFNAGTKTADIITDITDSTHASYRYDIAKTKAVIGNSGSMIMPCQFSGDIGTFRVKFTMKSNSDKLILKSLTINAPIPFDICYIRWLGIILISLFVYTAAKSMRFKLPFYQNRSFCNAFAAVFTAVCIIAAVKTVSLKNNIGTFEDLKKQFSLESGNQITQELVDAFEAGQVSLLDDVEQELLELDNPYDWSLRSDNDVKCKWDHVMYNGKYYSYYGIAPVILLFLPYHMITGYYFSTHVAVLIFGSVGMIFLTMTYISFISKFFWKIPSNIAVCGLMIIQTASGIWYSLGRSMFYEISISSGFAFITIGAYFLINSNIICWGKTSLLKLALSSFFLAIAVLCRPTLAVYCMAACVFYLFGFSDSCSKIIETENGRKSGIAYALCALLPMLVLAGIQMYYNYVRFDSPLEFGIKYSLTINDFTHSQYHTNFVLIGIYNYLFAVPSFKPEFPFITTPFTKLNVNGYYFSDTGNSSGILFSALPVFAYIFSRRVYILSDRKSRMRNAALIGIACVVMPLVIICSVWESGYAVRYLADFSWQIIFGALTVIFSIYMKTENGYLKNIIEKFMVIAVLWGFAVNIPQVFNFTFSADNFPELYYKTAGIFEFWR